MEMKKGIAIAFLTVGLISLFIGTSSANISTNHFEKAGNIIIEDVNHIECKFLSKNEKPGKAIQKLALYPGYKRDKMRLDRTWQKVYKFEQRKNCY